MVEHHPHDKLLAVLDHHVSHVKMITAAADEAAAAHQVQLDLERQQAKAAQS